MKESLDLSPLAADYDIVGELDVAAGERSYIATRKGDGTKRRDDQTGALISIVRTPSGDEANALSHLAADTALLARSSHRRLIPVIEGRWLGDDAFAVVTQRTTDSSLAQRLASGETFTNPRIAAILRELNGLLEWAREQKIVHRGIPATRVFLEPKTDRVRVAFAIAPILRLHRSDAQDDARTIARLAMAMLTGEVDPHAYEGRTLADLRPDLPDRLGEATATLLDEKNTGATPDVAAYLALIGMADPVAAGEAERERIRDDILEEQRAEREKLATERTTFERTIAEERASFERVQADAREKLERERIELQRAVTSERDGLQRAAEAERAELAAKRAELERVVAEQRAALERAALNDREQIERLRAEIRTAGEREVEQKRQAALEDISDADDALQDGELATPRFVAPMLAPLEPLSFRDDTPLMRDDDIVFEPSRDDATPAAGREAVDAEPAGAAPNRRKWILAGSAAAVLALIGISASVLGSRESAAPPVAAAAPRAAVARASVDPAPAANSPASAPPVQAPSLATDSSSIQAAARWLDSLKDANPVVLRPPRPVVRDVPVERPRPTIAEDPFFIPGSAPVPRVPVAGRDSAPRPDTTTPPPA